MTSVRRYGKAATLLRQAATLNQQQLSLAARARTAVPARILDFLHANIRRNPTATLRLRQTK